MRARVCPGCRLVVRDDRALKRWGVDGCPRCGRGKRWGTSRRGRSGSTTASRKLRALVFEEQQGMCAGYRLDQLPSVDDVSGRSGSTRRWRVDAPSADGSYVIVGRVHDRQVSDAMVELLCEMGQGAQVQLVRQCTGLATEDDHIIPLSMGGSDDRENHQGLCASCHRRKTLDEQRGRGVHAT